MNQRKENVQLFLTAIRKYTIATDVTREMLVDIFDKIIVHEATGDHRNGTREQTIDFYYRYIGEIPNG
jgi:hypothetical protein